MRTFVKIMVAAMVAAGMAVVLVAHGASGNMVVMTYFCSALMLCALLGVFDVREESKHESIRHRDGRRNYGQAAVFIGTAAIFMGTPKQCEDVADDLWHYGQQSDVRMLSIQCPINTKSIQVQQFKTKAL